MSQRLPDDAVFVAHHLSGLLTRAAFHLDTARDSASFVAALLSNGDVWRQVAKLAPQAGCAVAAEDIDFMATTSARASQGVDDCEVEAIIAINRRLAERLANLPRPYRLVENRSPLWRDWMGRHIGPVIWRGGWPDRAAFGFSEPFE